jgi:hypothetical protein
VPPWSQSSGGPGPLPLPNYTPQTPVTNTAATVGFVFGILSIIPCCCCMNFVFAAIGLGFSITGLIRAQSLPEENGKNLAIAGIIVSAVGILAGVGYTFLQSTHPGFNINHWPPNSF